MVYEVDDKEKRSCLGCRKAERVSVEIQLQSQHRLEDKVSRKVAQGIAEFLCEG